MGGGFSFSLKLGDSSMRKVSGKIVGMSGQDDVDVDVKNHSTIADGVYSVPASKGEAVKAILSEDALTEVNEDNVRKIVDDVYVDIEDLKPTSKSSAEQPTVNQAPSVSTRSKGNDLIDITADPEEYRKVIEEKVKNLYEKYVPKEMRDAPIESVIDAIVQGMGAKLDKDISDLLAEGVQLMQKYAKDKYAIGVSFARLELEDNSGNLSADAKANAERLVDAFDNFRAKLKTPEGKKELEQDVANGFLEILAGAEDFLMQNPEFRGKLELGMYRADGVGNLSDATAYASVRLKGQTRASFKAVFSTVFSQHAMSSIFSRITSKSEKENGQVSTWTVSVEGAGVKSALTAVHETSHSLYYDTAIGRLGVRTGTDSDSIADQLAAYGEIGNTVVGAMFAAKYGIDPSTSFDEFSDEDRALLARYVMSKVSATVLTAEDARKASALLPIITDETAEHPENTMNMHLLVSAALDKDNFDEILDGYEVDEKVNTYEKAKKFVEDIVGMPIDQLVTELANSISEDLGVNIAYLGTNGIPADEVFDALGSASQYAKTDVSEAYPEARSLLYLIDNLKSANLHGNEAKIQKMREIVEQITAQSTPNNSRSPKLASDKTKQLYSLYNRISSAMNDLDWEYL
jgi:hypothetical protein